METPIEITEDINVVIKNGDFLEIIIYDQDLLIDDFIGSITLIPDDIKELIRETDKNFAKDKILNINLEIDKLN